MTDPKKPRTPRELAPGKAIAMLKAIAEERGNDIETECERAKEAALLRVSARYEKRIARVLSRVHETARHGVEEAAGIEAPDETPEYLTPVTENAAAPATTEAADLPRGAQPMDPDRAARVERMAGRGAR